MKNTDRFDFDGLFILDVANNHQGDLDHGIKIIKELGRIIADSGTRAAIKFQFRQLESFIHPDYRTRSDIQHIDRFTTTKLSVEDYKELINAVRDCNLITMCTPFDEGSVELIENLDFDLIKVASCSATDLPLIERVAKARMPTVASTGGASIEQIDRMTQIFDSHGLSYALHHCVSIYPTPRNCLQLNQIPLLKKRYDPISIGWSTHEDPDDDVTVQLAYAKGATLFERHVGLQTKNYTLNSYSSNPDQIKLWIDAYKRAVKSSGAHHRFPPPQEESAALKSLERGVFASRPIEKGQLISRDDVFFAMPLLDGGLPVSGWLIGQIADKTYKENEPISSRITLLEESDSNSINSIMLQVRGMLRDARIQLGKTSSIEISHHYGLSRFREFGAVIIDVINREYCKKLIIQLPRQKHPYHYHKKKEETFQILYGDLEVTKNGHASMLRPGDLFLVEPNEWHKFSTLNGVVFEEISTTHYNDDSFYQDQSISCRARELRKTLVPNWEL